MRAIGAGSKTAARKRGSLRGKAQEFLAHLGSPDLEPIENAIAPFARETIRYRTVQIQRRARALREQLSLEEFVETVGMVTLANLVCRLGVVLNEEL